MTGLLLFGSLPAILMFVPQQQPPTPVPGPAASSAAPEFQPPSNLLTAEQKEAVFFDIWSLIDEEYPYFDRRNVDRDAVREAYLPAALATTNDSEFRPCWRWTGARQRSYGTTSQHTCPIRH